MNLGVYTEIIPENFTRLFKGITKKKLAIQAWLS